MGADRLREAARVLREVAAGAEPGPWEVRGGGLIARASSSPRFVWPPHATADGQYWEGQREHNRATATYIATMHPGVALALADWLDDTATEVASGATYSQDALRLADLILGADQ